MWRAQSILAGLLFITPAAMAVSPFQQGTFGNFGYNFLPPELLSDRVEILEDTVFNQGTILQTRGFLSFTVPALGPGQFFQSATLKLKISGYVSQGPDFSGGFPPGVLHNATENFTLYPVATTAPDLVLAYDNPGPNPGTPNPSGLAIYNDLGDPPGGYASFNVGAGDVGTQVMIPLNAATLTDLGLAAGGSMSLGMRFTGTPFGGVGGQLGAVGVNQGLRFDMDPAMHDLVLEIVPAPSTALLLALPLLAVRRRRDYHDPK